MFTRINSLLSVNETGNGSSHYTNGRNGSNGSNVKAGSGWSYNRPKIGSLA